MKRNIGNVTERHIRALEGWLGEDIGQDMTCPFSHLEHPCWLCHEIFPKLDDGHCPCPYLGLAYTKRVARKIIKELS